MNRYAIKKLTKLISVFLMFSNIAVANTNDLDKAVKIYYAGYPGKAIGLIEPLARSGDVDAQYLLGNILYSLSKTNRFSEIGDPIVWYEMAAAQQSSGANYALGVIYHDKWTESQLQEDITIAISYYEKATQLGYEDAQIALSKLKPLGKISTNNSKVLPKPDSFTERPKKASTNADDDSAKESGTAETTNGARQIISEDDDKEFGTVDLASFANQCKNYTQTGFNYYAESISGAFFEGNAEIDTIGPANPKSGTHQIRLVNRQFDISVLLNLRGVPKEVVAGLKGGQDFGIEGIVEHSKMTSTGCILILAYKND